MKALLWILLLGLLALVQGRSYCSGGRTCSKDLDCEQNAGTGGVYGWCCNGQCTNTYKILARGAFCNDSDPCAGECGESETCTNNVCTGYGVTETCTCAVAGDMMCNNVILGSPTIYGTCPLDTMKCTLSLPRDAACSMNSSCASNACYMGACLGTNLKVGSSCRISAECGVYQCLNGKCAYKSVGMPCTSATSAGCDSSKNFCNSTSLMCQQLLTQGMNCTASSQCISSLYCPYVPLVGYTNCTMKQGEGQDCSVAPCQSGLWCTNYGGGVNQCVKYGSVPAYGFCTNVVVCQSSSTRICGKYGANETANFCVPYYSQPAGANCSSSNVCPEYGRCNTTRYPYTCTESYLGKACDVNSTSSDTTMCGNLVCGCNNKCVVPDYPYTYTCANGAYYAPGDPTKMNSEDATATAKYLCCNYCRYKDEITTAYTGFDVNCESYKFRLKPVCNLTSGGTMALIGCGGMFTATANFSLLVALFASLVAYFY